MRCEPLACQLLCRAHSPTGCCCCCCAIGWVLFLSFSRKKAEAAMAMSAAMSTLFLCPTSAPTASSQRSPSAGFLPVQQAALRNVGSTFTLKASTPALGFVRAPLLVRGGRREIDVSCTLQQQSAETINGGATSTNSTRESALILIRHGESLWNSKNLFTGCVDVPLSQKGVEEAIEAGKRISELPVDMIFTSALIRAQMTAMLAMTQHHRQKVPVILHNESERAQAWSTIFSDTDEVIPVVTAWQLNERMYGELQGLNKKETADKFGDEQVKEWRRSYGIPPPNGESLEMCAERAVNYFVENVVPELEAGKNIMIAAHGNSLRAIIMYLDKLTPKEVIQLELSTGIPMLYTLKSSKFLRRGSPVGPTVHGVYALSQDLANYRDQSKARNGTIN